MRAARGKGTAANGRVHGPSPGLAAVGGRSGSPRRSRGIALVLVLWVITLLTVMAMALTATQRTEMALSRNQVDAARFRALADAAVGFALYRLLTPQLMTPEEIPEEIPEGETPTSAWGWLPDGQPHVWTFAGETLEVRIENENSRLDLNVVEGDQIEALLLALGLEAQEAGALADRILDWRDADDLPLLRGAEDEDYVAAGLPYGAKDRPFDSVEELQQVMGMTPELYAWMAPALTVNGDDDRVDETFASPLVLAALRGQTLEEAIEVEERRSEFLGPDAERSVRVDLGGPNYRILVTWVQDGRPTRTMATLVSTSGAGGPSLYSVLWRRVGLALDSATATAPAPVLDEAAAR